MAQTATIDGALAYYDVPDSCDGLRPAIALASSLHRPPAATTVLVPEEVTATTAATRPIPTPPRRPGCRRSGG